METNFSYFYDFIPVNYKMDDEERSFILEQFNPPQLPDKTNISSIDDVEVGANVSLALLLNSYTRHITKAKKQFLRLQFSNNSGTINATIWDNNGEVERALPLLEQHSTFNIEGKITEFNRQKSINISKLTPHQEEINPFDYLPATAVDINELIIELFSYLNELDEAYKDIAYTTMEKFWVEFSVSPAAKGFHHNYLGGLLKHTVGLMRFAKYIVKLEEDPFKATLKLINVVEKAHKNELWQQFSNEEMRFNLTWKDTINHLYDMLEGMMQYRENQPDFNIIITSILFHDIGKILEYDHAGKSYNPFAFLYPTAETAQLADRKQTGIAMDELGVMIGHIPYGVLLFTKLLEVENIPLSLEKIHEISHAILCHHALPEWGSCIRSPQTIDGYIIHIADFLDSRYENTVAVK